MALFWMLWLLFSGVVASQNCPSTEISECGDLCDEGLMDEVVTTIRFTGVIADLGCLRDGVVRIHIISIHSIHFIDISLNQIVIFKPTHSYKQSSRTNMCLQHLNNPSIPFIPIIQTTILFKEAFCTGSTSAIIIDGKWCRWG